MNCDGPMSWDQYLATYAYPTVTLFQPSKPQKQTVVVELQTLPPSEVGTCCRCCVYTIEDRRCAKSALIAVRYLVEAPLLG